MEKNYKRYNILRTFRKFELDLFGKCWLGWDPYKGVETIKSDLSNYLVSKNFLA